MPAFQSIVIGLRKAEKELEAQLAGVRAAISSLVGSGAGRKRGRPAGSTNKVASAEGGNRRKRRKMSARARAAISAAQKLRWAKQRAAQRK
jgi:hypothetical protein